MERVGIEGAGSFGAGLARFLLGRDVEVLEVGRPKRRDERTRAYVERRAAEGKSRRETMRCLKRYIARELYKILVSTMVPTAPLSVP